MLRLDPCREVIASAGRKEIGSARYQERGGRKVWKEKC